MLSFTPSLCGGEQPKLLGSSLAHSLQMGAKAGVEIHDSELLVLGVSVSSNDDLLRLKSTSAQDNGIASPILAPEKHRKRTKSQNSWWLTLSSLALLHSSYNWEEVKSCRFFLGTFCHLIRRAGDSTIHPSSIAERSTLRRVVRLRFSVRGETPVAFLRINPS